MANKLSDGFSAKIKSVLGIEGEVLPTIRPMLNYTCANITIGGAGYPINVYNQQFLSYVEGLSTRQSGKISFISGLWDAISDPIMGFITDRTRSKMGRHRPYLLFAAIPFAISYLFKWTSFGISAGGDTSKTWGWYVFAGLMYATFMTMMSIPHTAMLPTVAPNYFERTQYKMVEYIMNSVGQFSSYIFTALAIAGFNIKTALTALPNPSPQDRGNYQMVGIVLMIWFVWAPILCMIKTKEPSSLSQQNEPFDLKYVLKEYKLVFKNKAFRQYFIISLFFSMSRYFYNYADQYFMISVTDAYKFFNSLTIISGIAEAAGSPINYLLTRYKGKTFCGKLMGPFMVLGLLVNAFLSYSTPKGIKYAVIVISSVLYNIGFSGPGFVGENIQPDVTDVDELITGQRREGVISTFNTLFKKTVSSLMAYLVGASLEWFGYDTNIQDPRLQSKKTVFGLRLNYAVIPSVLALFCVISIFRYKMTKHDHEMIKSIIAEKHETGKCTVTDEDKKKIEDITGQKWEDMWIGSPTTPAGVGI